MSHGHDYFLCHGLIRNSEGTGINRMEIPKKTL